MTATLREPALLVVDDVPENLIAVDAALAPLGHRVLRAASGEDALRHLLTDDVGVIVLDVQMPGLDGFETARHIKDRESTRSIPIVFLTGHAHSHPLVREARMLPHVQVFEKPIDGRTLESLVTRH